MNEAYTSLGGGGDFPPTTWSMVVDLRGDTERQRGLETLCKRYWKPIYCYVRRRLRRGNEDAKDLTQGFFAWLVHGRVLERYDPERASFRLYLKGLLRNYARNLQQAEGRRKRGGGLRHLSLSIPDAEVQGLEAVLADPRVESPEAAFEKAWVDGLIERGLERTRQALLEAGHELRLRVYEAYELAGPGEQPTYRSVAEAFGIEVSAVRNHLFAVRERLRSEIRRELRETVSSAEQLEEEWRLVFG